MLRILLFLLLGLPLQGIIIPDYVPLYEEAVCPFTLPDTLIEGENAFCGYVTVPEDHHHPQGANLSLAVLRISVVDNPAPDPIVQLLGGPGRTIMHYMDTLSGEIGLELAQLSQRDFIVFDQRGTGYSQPLMACNVELRIALVDPEIDIDSACIQRLQDDGHILAAYNSVEIADDVDDLRRAMGYDQINLYGHSYGTQIAQMVMRDHPESVRSVLLESVVYPGAVVTGRGVGLTNVLERMFDDCRRVEACSQAFPDLETTFVDVVTRLRQEPVDGTFDDIAFIGLLYQLLEISSPPSPVPLFIHSIHDGDFNRAGRLWGERVIPDSQNLRVGQAMASLVSCADVARHLSATQVAEANLQVRPEILNWTQYFQEVGYFEKCARWPYAQLEPIYFEPLVSDIPTLVISGLYDQNTPLINAQYVAQSLNHSYLVAVPAAGHFPLFYGLGGYDCMRGLYTAFLSDPASQPDTSCVEAITPSFILP